MTAIECAECGAAGDSRGARLYCAGCYEKLKRELEGCREELAAAHEELERRREVLYKQKEALTECEESLRATVREKQDALGRVHSLNIQCLELEDNLEAMQASRIGDEWADVEVELEAQVSKWGVQHHPDGFWHLILAEEVGEVAQAILQRKRGDIEREIVQCAAVCLSWLRDRARYPEEAGYR